MAQAVYSTAVLKAENAPPYRSMAGKLHPSLLKALDTMGFEYMTPVQQKVLCELPSFRSDCLVQAKTGTGKTIAFLLPTLHSLLASPIPRGQVGILVMSPTRELALQIAKECNQLTSQLPTTLECHTAFGGTARASNLNRFISGSPAVLVATPGRLKDYLSEVRTRAKFSSLRTVILDEADTMLEQGFLADVKEILKLLPLKASCGWQGMCFSATVPPKVKDVINVVCKPGYSNLTTIDKSEPPTVDRVPQSYVLIPSPSHTFTGLCSVLNHEMTPTSKIIVFGITANLVALFARVFDGFFDGMKVFQLQSRLSQSVRTRTTEEFKSATTGIMFASDVIGRGMDFPNVSLVIQVGLPSSGQQYVHRVGRTARAGNDGRAIIILTQAESFFLAANRQLPIVEHAQHAQIINGMPAATEPMARQLYAVDEDTKRKAYSSYLGFFAGSGLMKPLRLDKPGLVAMANHMAMEGMLCPEPPAMEKSTVSKMGLKGIPGLHYLQGEALQARRPQQKRPAENEQPGSGGGRGGGGGGGGGAGGGREGGGRGGGGARGRGRNGRGGGGDGGGGGGTRVEKQANQRRRRE